MVSLGDLIDGKNGRDGGSEATVEALKTVLAPFKELSCPTYHMIGNHDLYNLTRRQILASELNSGKLPQSDGVKGELYYSEIVHPQLRLIILDTYEISVLGYKDTPNHPHFLEAKKILAEKNPNEEKNSAVGLKGDMRRFVAYNGGLSQDQLTWLDKQLTEGDNLQQNVILLCELI